MDEHRNLQMGDLVWLGDDSVKGCDYKIARVLETYSAKDRVIGTATVKMSSGTSKRRQLKLVPLFYSKCFREQNRAGNVGASKETENKKSFKNLLIFCAKSRSDLLITSIK